MGTVTRLDLSLKATADHPCCVGVGFVAADIVEGSGEGFVSAGGSCGNVMAILAWLGWNAVPVSRLGRDWASKTIRKDLRKAGVTLNYLSGEDAVQTPIVIQRFVEDARGQRTHRFALTCPECGGWLPRYRPITLAQADRLTSLGLEPKTFYLDRVSPAGLRVAAWARDLGALILFEPSSIGDERQFQKAVDLCHILKYSHDRLGHLRDLREAHNPRIIVETLAEEGLRVRWHGRWTELPAIEAPWFRDGAGSGDWCSAGLIHRLGTQGSAVFETLQNPRLLAALRFGQALAAVNCGYEGARGAMHALSRDEMAIALTKLSSRKPEPLPDNVQSTVSHDSEILKKICATCSNDREGRAQSKAKGLTRRSVG
jgi:sugar/nucleoside kinase (ribokinase family)